MRTRSSIWTIAVAVTVAAGLCDAPRAFAGDTERCQGAKLKAGGKEVFDMTKCHEKALKSGMPVDDACIMRLTARFSKAIAKADTLASCPGTENGIEAAVTACMGGLLGQVYGWPTTTTTTTLACSGGKQVGGYCWYMGNLGADCTSTCAAQGKTYDPATGSYAGSSGTALQCEAVLNAFGYLFDHSTSGGSGVGCGMFLGFPPEGIRDTDPTTASATFPSIMRACACY